MSTESTEAYLRAIDILRSIGRNETDIEQRLIKIEAELDAICDSPRADHPADAHDDGQIDVWEVPQLQRWYVETLMTAARRRSAARRRAAR
jgi:hypothetical protein